MKLMRRPTTDHKLTALEVARAVVAAAVVAVVLTAVTYFVARWAARHFV